MGDEEVNLKTLVVFFFLGIILLVVLFFIFNKNEDNTVSGATVLSNELETASVTNPPPNNPDIGEVIAVKSCNELDLNKEGIALIEDFEKDDSKKYTPEKENSGLELSIDDKNSICGRYLKIEYAHENTLDEFHAARINFNREALLDFKKYGYVNFLVRFEKDTSLINFVIFDRDNDFWWFKNMKPLAKDTWYLFKVPLDKLYVDKNNPYQGDGNQDFDGGRFMFAFEPGPESNTVYLDTFFVSK